MMTIIRLTGSPLSTLSTAAMLAVTLLATGTAFGASLSVSSTTVQEAGDTARVCVGLSSGGEDVAATQNDMVWDSNCASLVDKCEANPAHGKQLMSNQRGANGLRAIIISLQDTNTIPDGELYCCTFRADLTSGGACCAIGLQGMSASDPEGRALGLAGRGGQICLASGRGSTGGLEGGSGGRPQEVVSADLGSGAQEAAPAAGQPAAQAAGGAAQPAGSGNTVLSGGTGGVQGGVGGVPGGGVPGGQPGAGPVPAGQVARPQGAAPAEPAPAAVPEGGQPAQAPVAGTRQEPAPAAAEKPTAGVAAAPTSAPAAAAKRAAPAAKPAATAPAKVTAKAAAPAPPASSSGCSCEITPSGVGFEGSGALAAVGLLLWARRRRW